MLSLPLPRPWRSLISRHRGWSGLLAGVALGVVGTLLATHLVKPGTKPLEPGTITILSGEDSAVDSQRDALIQQWNKLPGVPHAKLVPLKGDADAHYSAMVAEAERGDSEVDVFNLDVPWMTQFIERGYLRPLEKGVDESGFLRKPLETCKHDDRLWALPFNTDAGLLFYRQSVVSGPPSSWHAMTKMASDVLLDPSMSFEAGYIGQLADYEGLTVNAIEAIWSAGGAVVDSDGEVVVDSPEAREGLWRLAQGLLETNPQIILPEAKLAKETTSMEAFRDGKVIFMRNWPVAYRQIAQKESDFNVAVLPGPSVLGGQNLAIAKSSDQPRAAQKLIEFLTSERSQQILFERGGLAATRHLVYQDVKVRDQYPYAQTLLNAVQGARLRPLTRNYPVFSAEFRRGVQYALGHSGEWPPGFTQRLSDALQGKVPVG